jgi:hypothetical protein
MEVGRRPWRRLSTAQAAANDLSKDETMELENEERQGNAARQRDKCAAFAHPKRTSSRTGSATCSNQKIHRTIASTTCGCGALRWFVRRTSGLRSSHTPGGPWLFIRNAVRHSSIEFIRLTKPKIQRRAASTISNARDTLVCGVSRCLLRAFVINSCGDDATEDEHGRRQRE